MPLLFSGCEGKLARAVGGGRPRRKMDDLRGGSLTGDLKVRSGRGRFRGPAGGEPSLAGIHVMRESSHSRNVPYSQPHRRRFPESRDPSSPHDHPTRQVSCPALAPGTRMTPAPSHQSTTMALRQACLDSPKNRANIRSIFVSRPWAPTAPHHEPCPGRELAAPPPAPQMSTRSTPSAYVGPSPEGLSTSVCPFAAGPRPSASVRRRKSSCWSWARCRTQ